MIDTAQDNGYLWSGIKKMRSEKTTQDTNKDSLLQSGGKFTEF